MSLLLTAPYDPWKQTDWVSHIIGLASQMQQQRAKDAIQQQQHEDQMRQQALQNQRLGIEFDRRMEFDKTKNAFEQGQQATRLGFEVSDHAPFGGGPDQSQSPSPSSLVTPLPTGGTQPDGSIANPPALDAPTGNGPSGGIADPSTVPADNGSIPAGTDVSQIPGMPGAPPLIGDPSAPPANTPSPASTVPNLASGGVAPAPASPSATVPALASNALPAGGGANPAMPLFQDQMPNIVGKKTPAQQIAESAAMLKNAGVFDQKHGEALLQQQAARLLAPPPVKPTVRNMADGSTQQYDATTGEWTVLARKPTTGGQSMSDALESAGVAKDQDGNPLYNKAHGTYQRTDGSEFFTNQGANGRWTVRAFRPDSKPAKVLWGDDGNVYPMDAQGNPLKPVPDGVQLRDHSKLQIATTPGGGKMVVNPDGTLNPLIPEGIKMDAKSQDSYVAAAQAFREAQVELDTQTKLLKENPGTTGWFGGGTKGAVDEAQKKFDAAKAKVEGIRKDFPQLNPSSPAQRAAPTYPVGSTAVKDGKTYVRTATGWQPQ